MKLNKLEDQTIKWMKVFHCNSTKRDSQEWKKCRLLRDEVGLSSVGAAIYHSKRILYLPTKWLIANSMKERTWISEEATWLFETLLNSTLPLNLSKDIFMMFVGGAGAKIDIRSSVFTEIAFCKRYRISLLSCERQLDVSGNSCGIIYVSLCCWCRRSCKIIQKPSEIQNEHKIRIHLVEGTNRITRKIFPSCDSRIGSKFPLWSDKGQGWTQEWLEWIELRFMLFLYFFIYNISKLDKINKKFTFIGHLLSAVCYVVSSWIKDKALRDCVHSTNAPERHKFPNSILK